MEPIINPWLIYISQKCETIGILCMIFGAIGLFVAGFWYILHLCGEVKEKVPKWIVVTGITCSIISTLLPTQKTILTMATLQYITPNNVTVVGETAEDIVDYITDKIEEIMNDKD